MNALRRYVREAIARLKQRLLDALHRAGRVLRHPLLHVRLMRAREMAEELLVSPGLHPQLRYMVVMYEARLRIASRAGIPFLRHTVADVESELAEVRSLLHRGR